MKQSLIHIHALLLMAAMLLGAGLTSPAMTIQPAFGKFDTWIKLLQPDATRPSTYSLLEGIARLFNKGDAPIAILLFAFSVCFPSIKLALMGLATARVSQGRSSGLSLALAHHGGKFSMLDVLVLAMLVLAIKGLPGGSKIDLRVGVWLFAVSVAMSLFASLLLQRAERRARAASTFARPS